MKRREAEGKPVIDIDAEDRAKKEVEQVGHVVFEIIILDQWGKYGNKSVRYTH